MMTDYRASKNDESVCVVEEDILEEPSAEYEEIKASVLHDADKQPPLQPVNYSTSELPQDDVNTPNETIKEEDEQEVPPPPPPPQPTPPVVVEDFDLKESDTPNNNIMDTPSNPDVCCQFLCCGYPNGVCQIFATQFFLAVGLMLCGWGMIDCQFIEATAGYPDLYWPDGGEPTSGVALPEVPPPMRRGFGMFWNETQSGGCFSERDTRYWVWEEVENYVDFLGSDWDLPRFLAAIAVSIGWLAWFLLLLFMCCSCVKAIRFLYSAFLMFLVAGFQAAAFAVLGSDFCNTETANCEPARGFWIMVAGITCYVIASLMIALTKDFPGR